MNSVHERLMAPSSIKKMSRGGGRTEGNYASTEMSQSSGSSLNDDLGLTLFPGSQTQRVDEDSGDVSNSSLNISGRDAPENGQHGKFLGSGKVKGSIAPSTVLDLCEGDVEDDGCQRNDCSYLRSGKRRKLNDRGTRHLVGPGNDENLTADTARKPKTVDVDVAGSDQDRSVEALHEAIGSSSLMVDDLSKAEQSKVLGRECSSGSASALDSIKCGISGKESSEDGSLHSTHINADRLRPDNIFARSATTHVKSTDSHERGLVVAPSVLKLPVEPERSEKPTSVVRGPSSSTSQHLPPKPANFPSRVIISSSLRQRVSRSRNQVLRSWTSHFPKASRKSEAKRYLRRPATSSAVPASLTSTNNHQPPHIKNSPSFNFTKYQHPSTLVQAQLLSILNDIPSPTRKIASRSQSCAPEESVYSVTARHQRLSSHRRTRSLPNLVKHRVPNMESTYVGGPLPLPTPPREARSLSSRYPPSNVLFTSDRNMFAEMQKVGNASHTLTPSRPASSTTHQVAHAYHNHQTMLGDPFMGAADTSYPPSHFQHKTIANQSATSQSSISQEVYSNGALMFKPQPHEQTARTNSNELPRPQHPAGHAAYGNRALMTNQQHFDSQQMRQNQSSNSVDVGALGNGTQHSSQSPQSQSPDDAKSQQVKYKEHMQHVKDHVTQCHDEIKRLKQELEKSNRYQIVLAQRLHFHEQGEGAQRIRHLEFAHAQKDQHISALLCENGELNRRNEQLLSEMKGLAGKPPSDVFMANNILRNLGPSAERYQIHHRPSIDTKSPQSSLGVFQPLPSASARSTTYSSPINHAAPMMTSGQGNLGPANSPNEQIGMKAAASTDGHLATSPPTNLLIEPFPGCQLGLTGSLPSESANLDGNPVNTANVLSESVAIDLTTDESSPSDACDTSASLPHGAVSQAQSSPAQTPEDLQSHANFTNEFAKKSLEWYDGIHPGRVTSDYSLNFGLDSRKDKPINYRSQARGSNSPKKTKDVFKAVETLSTEQRDQTQREQLEKKRAKQAAYSRKHNEKKKAKTALGNKTDQGSHASPNTQRHEKQPRQLAKTQKRKEQTRKPLSQVQKQVTQKPLDGGSHEKSAKTNVSISSQGQELTSEMELDALFADDAELDEDSAMQGSDRTQASESTDDDEMEAEFAKELEAELARDAENELAHADLEARCEVLEATDEAAKAECDLKGSGGDPSTGEYCAADFAGTDMNPLGGDHGLHDFSASEESEEE